MNKVGNAGHASGGVLESILSRSDVEYLLSTSLARVRIPVRGCGDYIEVVQRGWCMVAQANYRVVVL